MSNKFNKTVTLKELCAELNIKHNLKDSLEIKAISDSNATTPYSICDYIKGALPAPKENLILLTKEPIEDYIYIIVESPQETIINIINFIKNGIGFQKEYANSTIPACVMIGQNVVIEDDVLIGEGTIIEHNVVIHSGTKIGKNCLIRTHSSIGGDGYGYVKTKEGMLVKQPHLGGVELADNVEIGSNSCVVKGIVNDTYIGKNVKVDNLVHIAHDCYIDDDAFIIAGSELSGYVTVGKRSRIAPNACVKQRVTIGDDVIIGMGAVILKDVKNNEVMIGNPAKPLRQFGKKN